MRGGLRGTENCKTAQKYTKKPQTASDFFPNTETARPLRFQLRPQRPHLPLSRIESKQRKHEAVRLHQLTSGMEFQEADPSLAKTVNQIKYLMEKAVIANHRVKL